MPSAIHRMRSIAMLLLLVVHLHPAEALQRPAAATMEELLEQVDAWLYEFDEDEDDQLNEKEMGPLLRSVVDSSASLREQGTSEEERGALAEKMEQNQALIRQADADGDQQVSRTELVDYLVRMKRFDGGHIEREAAATPKGEKGKNWAEVSPSHEERMRKKRKKTKKSKAAKDET
jgi:hypothetical protein